MMEIPQSYEEESLQVCMVLFGSESQTTPCDERCKLAQKYIDACGHKDFSDQLFEKAGITDITLNPGIKEDSKKIGSDPKRRELTSRLNYCQLTLQSAEENVPPFSLVYKERTVGANDLLGYTSPAELKGNEYRVVKEPFSTNGIRNCAFQMDEDSKREYVNAVQMMNRASSMIGLDSKPTMPDPNLMAILYFKKQ